MTSTAPPHFEYLVVRPCDVEQPANIPVSPEEFLYDRVGSLSLIDSWVKQGFEARSTLLKKTQQQGGLDAFKRQWLACIERGGDHAAGIMA